MKVLSLFDGISCGMVAFERVGIDVDKYVAYEIDNYATQISSKNYPNIEHKGNVFDADFSEYKGFDILIGGSPCTYWSISKNSSRETTPDGMGGQLFMQYVRALKESGCKWFLYENNFSIHQNIKDFISEQLGVLPLDINSALVSGQTRKRCYWTNIPFLGLPTDKGIVVEDILEPNVDQFYNCTNTLITLNDNPSKNNTTKSIRLGNIGTSTGQANRIYSINGKSVCLQAQAGGGGAKTGLYKIDNTDGSYIVRKLTPLETERLQTLPDNYTEGIPETQRYKCIGNGWTVDVIAHLLKPLKDG